MKYTKAIERDHTEWTLTEFIRVHGKFSKIHEYDTDKWYGQFNNKGIHTITCVAKAVRNIPINDMIDNSDKYSVVVLGAMYCVCQRWEDVELENTDNSDELSGGEVNHSKVLVLIYPQSEKKNVSTLLNIVKDW